MADMNDMHDDVMADGGIHDEAGDLVPGEERLVWWWGGADDEFEWIE